MPKKLSRTAALFGLFMLLGAAALLVWVGMVPRLRTEKERDETRAVLTNPQPEVVTLKPRLEKPDRELSLPGGLEAFQEVPINARADGYISHWFVDIGDHVRSGQQLALIDAPELKQRRAEAVADVVQAEAAVAESRSDVDRIRSEMARLLAEEEQARAEVGQNQAGIEASKSEAEFAKVSNDRWQKLVSEQAISLQEADQRASVYHSARANVQANQEKLLAARSRVKAAQARMVALKAEIATGEARVRSAQATVAAKQAIVDRIGAQLAFCVVEAPFSGQITQRLIDVGSLVSAGGDKTTLFRLARSNRLRVFVDVPEPDVPFVKVGQKAVLQLKEFPGRSFQGQVTRTAGALDKSTRTLKTQIELNNPGVLDAGMHADVHMNIHLDHPACVIPSTAVLVRPDGSKVGVLDSDHRFHLRTVQLGLDYGKEIEVVRGVGPQDEVVNFPPDDLTEGTQVRVTGSGAAQ